MRRKTSCSRPCFFRKSEPCRLVAAALSLCGIVSFTETTRRQPVPCSGSCSSEEGGGLSGGGATSRRSTLLQTLLNFLNIFVGTGM